jgi:hypothetical protein
MKRLEVIMGLRSIVGDIPYKELDALYCHIFSCVGDFSITSKMLGVLSFTHEFYLVNIDFLALLLGLDEEDIYLCLSELYSILDIPLSSTRGLGIRATHASLQDFLVDKLRSGKYFLDEEAFHTDLAQQCIRQISTLSMDRALKEVSGLEEYSMKNFTYHCPRASTDSIGLKDDLMQLRDLGPWFEVVVPNRLTDFPSYRLSVLQTFRLTDFPSFFAWLSKVCS